MVSCRTWHGTSLTDTRAPAVAISAFLDNTRSQLTYTGLFTLASLPLESAGPSESPSTPEPTSPPSANSTTAEPKPPQPELFALFRNSHLAVLYRYGGSLYTLVTDQVFLHEPSVVWERLEDVDQGAAVFVNSAFERATPAGGDWAGWSPPGEGTVDPVECVFPPLHRAFILTSARWISRALALELQNEEDERAHRAYVKRQQERDAQKRREQHEERRWHAQDEEKRKEKTKKEKECLIM